MQVCHTPCIIALVEAYHDWEPRTQKMCDLECCNVRVRVRVSVSVRVRVRVKSSSSGSGSGVDLTCSVHCA
jgi:hypothetical protein